MSDMGGVAFGGLETVSVYRTATYVLSATGWSTLSYTHVLKNDGAKFDISTSLVRIKRSGIYLLYMAAAAGGVDILGGFNINGTYYPLTMAGFNTSGGKVVWLDENDTVGAAIYKTASATMTMDIGRAFVVAGPLK